MEELKMYRYPGIQPFTKDQKRIFKGRSEEKKELISLIKLYPLTVLFSKSGIGKSSLIQAGVQPELEKNIMMPVFIRVNNINNIPPEVQFYNQLIEQGFLNKDTPKGLTLWEYMKKARFVRLGNHLTPLLIFDQFEELFTLYEFEDRQNFMKQFAEIANGGIPQSWAATMAERKDNIHPKKFESLMKPLNVKILLALRSDMLHYLDGISDYVPGIFRCLYELNPLTEANAIEAITGPAEEVDDEFVTKPFTYSEAAMSDIIEFLQKKTGDANSHIAKSTNKNHIESSNLQVVCERIEKLIIATRKKNANVTEVTPALYNGKNGLEEIIDDFYRRAIEQFPKERQDLIKNAIERGLMKNERRLSMEKAYLIDEFGITEEELLKLVNSRLLRKEPRMGSDYYEISHDTLIAPIYRSFLINKEEEDKIKEAEAKLKEAERQAEIRKKRNRRIQSILGITGIVIAILALISAWFAFKQSQHAKDNLDKAELAADTAKVATRRADSLTNETLRLNYKIKIERSISKAKTYNANQGYEYALKELERTTSNPTWKKYIDADSGLSTQIEELKETCLRNL